MSLRAAERVYLITDTARAAQPVANIIADACKAGLRLVQCRDKDMPEAVYVAHVRATVEVARRHGARTLLNGRWSLLADVGADGVHVPSAQSVAAARSAVGSDPLVGHSAHDRDEIRAAVDGGADFVTLSPVFPTDRKSVV